jgi:hypothetical protein
MLVGPTAAMLGAGKKSGGHQGENLVVSSKPSKSFMHLRSQFNIHQFFLERSFQ